MASTSSTTVMPERDASLQVLMSTIENLRKEDQQKLEPFLPEIEGYILKTIEDVPEERVKRKRREVIIAAAIYDTFLKYQQRTQTKVNMTVVAESLGLNTSAVNTAWLRVFDCRVKIDVGLMERVRGKSKSPKHLLSEVMINLKRAVPHTSEELSKWFDDVEKEAKNLIDLMDRQARKDFHCDEIAVTAVYGVIRKQGKPMVPLSQRDATFLCNTSSATISKIWIEVFHEGRES